MRLSDTQFATYWVYTFELHHWGRVQSAENNEKQWVLWIHDKWCKLKEKTSSFGVAIVMRSLRVKLFLICLVCLIRARQTLIRCSLLTPSDPAEESFERAGIQPRASMICEHLFQSILPFLTHPCTDHSANYLISRWCRLIKAVL